MPRIDFFDQDIDFKIPKPGKARTWIQTVILREKKKLIHLNYIFCSDEYLLSLNQQYLKHNTLTDIITFDASESTNLIEGDIFISVDRVRANAERFHSGFDEELHRVLVHGVLHLAGYADKTPAQRTRMRKKRRRLLIFAQFLRITTPGSTWNAKCGNVEYFVGKFHVELPAGT